MCDTPLSFSTEVKVDIYERWEALVEGPPYEFLEFHRVAQKRSQRPDLHAFLLLDEMFPGDTDIVSGVGPEEIYLDVSEEQAESLSDAHIVELARCGVFLDEETGCLKSLV